MQNFNEKSRNAYNLMADNYEKTSDGKFTHSFKQLLLSNMQVRDNDNVLDVGCGNGRLLFEINKRRKINGFGIDVSEEMIKNALMKNPDMELYPAGCESMPFDNNVMDIVIACASYHHFPNPKDFVSEVERVIKVGGKVYIAEIYITPLLKAIVNPFVPLLKAGDVKFYSDKEIINTFVGRNFKHIKTIREKRIQMIELQRI